MAMSVLWTVIMAAAILCGCATGRLEQVSQAAMSGAQSAVELCLSLCGSLCLWTGVLEVLRRCGVLEQLQRGMRPVLGRLFPELREDGETLGLISANLSANLLGLGNAATPFGVQAAARMAQGCGGVASHSLCLFVVCNTASLQLIPTTVAALRAGAGCGTPFDILPCVWVTSAASLTAGILAATVLGRLCGERKIVLK